MKHLEIIYKEGNIWQSFPKKKPLNAISGCSHTHLDESPNSDDTTHWLLGSAAAATNASRGNAFPCIDRQSTRKGKKMNKK